MAEEELDAFLARMPAIANAVNAFKSEEVQKEAFAAMVAAFTGQRRVGRPADNATPILLSQPEAEESNLGLGLYAERAKSSGRRKGGGVGKSFKPVELDLRPTGKQSFEEFVLEKQPQSNEDKYAVAVYYLEQVLGLSGITIGHIATVFRLTKGWREPGDVQAGIKMAANRKGTINTSSYSDLKTTPHGRNFVEHDLPPTVAKKKQ